jgi:hypothetical protein
VDLASRTNVPTARRPEHRQCHYDVLDDAKEPPMSRCTTTLASTGLLWTLAIAVQPDSGSTARERYGHIAAHPSLEGLSGLMFYGVAALLVLSGVAVCTTRLSGRGARTIAVGGVLVGLSSLWLAAVYAAFNLLTVQLVQVKVPTTFAYQLINGGADPWQQFLDVALLCVLAGPAVLAIGLRRAGQVSWLPVALWVVGILAYAGTEFVFKPGQIVAMLVCTVALYLMGRGLDTLPAGQRTDAGVLQGAAS